MSSKQHPQGALSKIPVMILCGGEGSRLKEETELRPKPMLEIGNRPILWHIMNHYAAYGLKDFILCLGYKGHIVKDYFLNYKTYGSDLTIELGNPHAVRYHNSNGEEDWRVTLVETGQKTMTGTRVARAAKYVEADTFCLTYGDGLGDIDIDALLKFHRQHRRLGTVTGVRPPGRFGELRLSKGDQAVEFNEKLQSAEGLINGGFFVFQREFVDRYLHADQEDCVLEREPLQRLAREDQLMAYVHKGFWQPMDTFREWRLLNDLWESGNPPWWVKWSSSSGRRSAPARTKAKTEASVR
jgi:glucose-1-phosphate cytidylyltransferase